MMSSGGQKSKSGARTKKNKSWASRERAGMSFIFVLAFFAVFGIIILTEVRIFKLRTGIYSNFSDTHSFPRMQSQVFVMDDRTRTGGVVRHSGMASRFGESVPDYEEVQVRC